MQASGEHRMITNRTGKKMKTKEHAPRARKSRSASKAPSRRGKLKRSANRVERNRFEDRIPPKPEQTRPRGNPRGEFGMLIPELQRAIAANGYSDPTPIQAECIPHLIDGRDLIGTAQTGTGKTAAFTLPLLQQLSFETRRPRSRSPRALILAPTRELAAQIKDSLETYGRFLHLTHTVIFGGVSQFHQVKAMHRGIDVLVATPGRLLDLMNQGHVQLQDVQTFILDEVDRMLDMGFIPDIEKVLAKLPTERQTQFYSATMNAKMEKLARTMVTSPVRIAIEPETPAVESINQTVLFVGQKNKNKLLLTLWEQPGMDKVIIFTQMKHQANRVVEKLEQAGIKCVAIHGNKSQAARTKALDGFKCGRYEVLVATDVAARGLDVEDITHVVNYDLPMEAETYVHRIGRTGRAGMDGQAISFCSAEDRSLLREIEKLLGKPVPAEKDHPFHCNQSYHSSLPAPKNFGRGRNSGASRSSQGGRSKNRFNHNRRRTRKIRSAR